MNRSMIRYLLSKLLLIEAALLIVPLVVATIYQEPAKVFVSIGATMAILLGLGLLGSFHKPKDFHIYAKEGVLIVALCWILWSFFGALPFVFSGQIPNIIDAFFEVSSGFTTTGATILDDVGVLTHSLLFWRSFTHLIGGMGVLVFALALMDHAKNGHLEVMKAEVPGPVFGKVVSKLKNTAQILYFLYLGLFFLFVVLYFLAGMPLYDSFVIAMGTAGTGGFTVFNDGIAHYNSSLITYLVSIGVLVFGVNFNLYYFLMIRKFKAFFKDEELRTYITIVLVSSVLIAYNVLHLYANVAKSFEISFFQVSNIITTTGFGYGTTEKWLKVIRCLTLWRIAKNQVLSTLSPNRVLTLHVNDTVLDKDTQHQILKYFTIYSFITIGLLFVVSLDNNNFMTVVSAVFSCFNNIGPMIGTGQTFSIFSPISKLLLSLAMIAGRLEIYPMILLFLPKTWSKR